MIRPRVAAGVDGHGVGTLSGSYERVPGRAGVGPVVVGGAHGGYCGAHLFGVRVAAVLKEAIGEEIGTGHADVFYFQTQIGRVSIGEIGFGVAGQDPSVAGGGEERDSAIAGVQVFIDLPCLRTLFEGAKERVAFNVNAFGRYEA
jgi:hypothetical protein